MNLPYQIEFLLKRRAFDATSVMRESTSCKDIQYDKNNVYTKALIINVTNGKSFFVPIAAASEIECEVASNFRGVSQEIDISFLFPLISSNQAERKTSDGVFKIAFGCPIHGEVVEISLKGTKYYGCKGAIFDCNWVPIIMLGFKAHIADMGVLRYEEPVIYLNPSVITNTDLVSKALLKKVVPFFLEHWRDITRGGGTLFCKEDTLIDSPIRVIIEDVSHMVYSPAPPKVLNYSDEISEMLAREEL